MYVDFGSNVCFRIQKEWLSSLKLQASHVVCLFFFFFFLLELSVLSAINILENVIKL